MLHCGEDFFTLVKSDSYPEFRAIAVHKKLS